MKTRAWLLLLAICAALLAALGTFKYRQISSAIEQAANFPEPVATVELAVAASTRWLPTVTVTAEIVAVQEVPLRNELAGRIVELGFEPGQRITAGQLLVRFDTREEQAQIQAARADARLARLALDRNQRLAKTGAASAEALDQAAALYNAADARVDGLQAIIDKKTLRAPFEGLAGLHRLSVGQYLEAGTVMTRLVGTGQGLWIDFNLPQHQAQLVPGDKISVTVPRRSDSGFEATIIARDAWVSSNSRNVRFRARPDDKHIALNPGTLVTVTVPLGEGREASLVPATAVRRDTYGAHVFVLEAAEADAGAPERAQRRPVTTGDEHDQAIIILSGVEPGERIAGNGAFKLRQGLLVDAVEPKHADAGTE